jgi:hypothetical protein
MKLPYLQFITLQKLCCINSFLIDVRTIQRANVTHYEPAIIMRNLAMSAGYGYVIEGNIRIGMATDIGRRR